MAEKQELKTDHPKEPFSASLVFGEGEITMIEIREKGKAEFFSGQCVVNVAVNGDFVGIAQYNSHFGESGCAMPYLKDISFPKSMAREIANAILKEID